MTSLIQKKIFTNKNMSIINSQNNLTQYNLTIGELYSRRLVSSAILLKKISLITDYKNCKYNYFLSFIFKKFTLDINDFIFDTLIKLVDCFNVSLDNHKFKSLACSIIIFTDGYLDSLNLLAIDNSTDINSLITNVILFVMFYINTFFSFISFVTNLINGICLSNGKLIECLLIKIFEFLQPYISIFFPCDPLNPLQFQCPQTKIKIPKEHLIFTVGRIILKSFDIDIPEGEQKTVNIATHLYRIEIGEFSKYLTFFDAIDVDSIIQLILICLSEFEYDDYDLDVTLQLNSNHDLVKEFFNVLNKLKDNSKFNLKESIEQIRISCNDVPIAVIFKDLILLLINILKPSTMRKIKNLNCIIISFVMIVLPVLLFRFACCTNCFHFMYLNLRFIIDNIYLLKWLDHIILSQNYLCQNVKDELNLRIYDYISFILNNVSNLPLQIVGSWLTLKPRMPKPFIDNSTHLLKLISDTLVNNGLSTDCKYNGLYLTICNLIEELNSMKLKQYKSKNIDKCDYCGLGDIFDSCNSCC